MAAKTFAQARAEHTKNTMIRKAKKIIVAIAPITVPVPERITVAGDPTKILDLSDWWGVGLTSAEGVNHTAEYEEDETTPHGEVDPGRVDVLRAPKSVSFAPYQWANKNMLAVQNGMNLDGLTINSDGEYSFDLPELPEFERFRMLTIAADGPMNLQHIFARCYTAAQMSNPGEENWGGEAIAPQWTFRALMDHEAGTACRVYYGGTGAKQKYKDLGFDQLEDPAGVGG